MSGRVRALLQRFRNDRRGAAAVEFAFIAPILIFIFAATVDFGAVIYKYMRLNESLSHSANFAIVRSGEVNASGAEALAGQLALLLSGGSGGSAWASSAVTVNGGASATVTDQSLANGGSAAASGACYCPTRAGDTIDWGTAMSCNAECDGGARAGRYVWLTASVAHRPFFNNYGLVSDDALEADVLVRTQ